MATPVLMFGGGNGSAMILIITFALSAALMTITFFGLRWWKERKNPKETDVKETNRQRREREKLERDTTNKVNAFMSGEKYTEKEYVPNGKRCGKYKKKNKKKK